MLWLTLVGVAAAGACWLLPWPPWVSAVATLATMVWYLGSLHRHALAGGPARGLRWAGGWEVRDGRQWQPAQLCAAVVWPPMVFLRLRGPAGIISFWLLPDRVEPHLLRRLRVTLRHPPPIRR